MKHIWGMAVIVALFVGGTLMGQLNQSGGTGANVATTQSGTWTMQPGNTANTTPWLASLSQGGNTAQVTAGGGLKIDGSAVTQPVSGTLTMVPKTACGSTAYDSGMVTLPNTSTALTATSTCVNTIIFVNTTASTQTVTVTDNQGAPLTYLTGFQIPANSTFVYDLQFAKLTSGVKWSATNASAVNAQVVGLQ
ncbi:MAG: hypothetical protein ABL995_17650 [Bryobacteraceae bacterium]